MTQKNVAHDYVPAARPIGEYAEEPALGESDAKRTYANPEQSGSYDPSLLRWGFVVSDYGRASYDWGNLLEVPRDLPVGAVMGNRAGDPVPLDFTAADAVPFRILIYPARKDVDARRSFKLLSGNAVVLGSQLQWPPGATPDQIAAAIALLRQNNRIEVV